MANVPLQSLLEQANGALETGAVDQAIGIAQHILHNVPELIEGHRLLGEAYLNANQPQLALGAFEQVLRADPENIAAYYGLGLGQQALEQHVNAIRSFERALEIQPNLAELRTQLTRLYTETPGSPGQFRLSRPGLGRLYARGEMYSQAIDEFRAVLDAEPERNDVRVALAEALWREGQENEAADWCREALDHQPQLHKPTLILGYLQLAGGQPEGDKLWRRAVRQDPHLTMARTLFNVLPPVRLEEPQLPAFDPQAWNAEKERLAQAAKPAPVAAAAATDQADDSWLSDAQVEAEQAAQLSAKTPSAPATPAPDDDLLASLLGVNDLPKAPATSDGHEDHAQAAQIYDAPSNQPDTGGEFDDLKPFHLDAAEGDVQPFNVDDVGGVQPFSLDDYNFDGAPESRTPQHTTDTAQERKPATFDDTAPVDFSWQEPSWQTQQPPAAPTQGKSIFDKLLKRPKRAEPAPRAADHENAAEEEFFSLDDGEKGEPAPHATSPSHPAAVQSPAPATNAADEPELTPFSLADLGLTEDEIAEFERPQAQGRVAPMPSMSSDEPELAPFSLADLGLTEDEIAELEQTTAYTEPTEAEPHVPAAHNAPVEPSDAPTLKPFSLAELGLSEEEISEFDLGESPLPSVDEIARAQSSQVEHQPTSQSDVAPVQPPAQPAAPPQPEPIPIQPTAQVVAPVQPPPAAQPVAPVQPQQQVTRVTPAVPAPVRQAAQDVGVGNLQSFQTQLAADPNNDTLRLAIARMSEQTGNLEQALDDYKQLLWRNALVEQVSDDLQELIAGYRDPALLRRLHRLLGDAYMKQDRFREAMEEYSWTPARGA